MAKGTILLLFFLVSAASLLLGITIGKNIAASPSVQLPAPVLPTPSLAPPTQSPVPDESSSSNTNDTQLRTVNGTSYFTDNGCGFSFSLPASFVRQQTENGQTKIFADPDNPDEAIATACANSIPTPNVVSENIESITLSGIDATLYHDENPDGTPRDEIIATHPTNGMEIIIAGYGKTFGQAVSSFRFLP